MPRERFTAGPGCVQRATARLRGWGGVGAQGLVGTAFPHHVPVPVAALAYTGRVILRACRALERHFIFAARFFFRRRGPALRL